jgi:hypothetical protein
MRTLVLGVLMGAALGMDRLWIGDWQFWAFAFVGAAVVAWPQRKADY